MRPDYGVSIAGAISGYVEVKAPVHRLDPAKFTGHDKRQWERQRDLPNLIYTNGTQWRLYRDGEPRIGPVDLTGGELAAAGRALQAPPELEKSADGLPALEAAPITAVGALVRAVAPLTRLLRGEVLDQLAAERKAVAAGADPYGQPFTGLARDWRALLFPQASDATFADGYAQAVTFALLLARTEGIDVTGQPLHEIGAALGNEHSLMGKALQLLTDDVAADFRVTLDLLVRVVGAVDWSRVRRGRRDTYLHLYEHFLELYDNDLRKKSGSYYTPLEVVEQMVRLTEEALVTRLGKATGFRDPDVLTVDPAMGTGTYLHAILERAARAAEQADGPGAVAGSCHPRSPGAWWASSCRWARTLWRSCGPRTCWPPTARHRPPGGMRLYVTDTLDDPYAAQTQIGSGLQLIAAFPPQGQQGQGQSQRHRRDRQPALQGTRDGRRRLGRERRHGTRRHGSRAILEDFFVAGAGRFKAKLKNLYIYFWRWATWKVWESTVSEPDGDAGIVCFISTSGYLTGPAFTGMREYLRRHASEGWIIDLTPEGQTPDVQTRIFPGVRQPLAIGMFLRRPDASDQVPAMIRYQAVTGRQEDKFAALAGIGLDGSGWREVRTGWADSLTPASAGNWDTYPALSDLMPWYSPGIFPTRTWVYAPSAQTLRMRWRTLMGETDPKTQAAMFKEGRDATMDKAKDPLPGADTHRADPGPLRADRVTQPHPVRVGYRSFDRQWIVPDSRVMDMARRDLWAARIPGQVFVVEQHAHVISDGPGVVLSALIPDFDYFNTRGGRSTALSLPGRDLEPRPRPDPGTDP